MLSILLLLLMNVYAADSLILNSGDIDVIVSWEPIEIKPNELVTFKLTFMKNGTLLNSNYDFIVLKDNIPIKEVKNSFTLDGVATHVVEFPSSGSFTILINLLDKGDTITFDLRVTPEFPTGSIIIVVTLIGVTIALTRFSLMSKNNHPN